MAETCWTGARNRFILWEKYHIRKETPHNAYLRVSLHKVRQGF